MKLFERLLALTEVWDAQVLKRAISQHQGKVDEKSPPPTEKDLVDYKPYKLMVDNFPSLEKQLKLAWNGDIKVLARGGAVNDDYIFPKLLKPSNLKKYDPKFAETRETMQVVKELYELFFKKFRIADKTDRKWFESKQADELKLD